MSGKSDASSYLPGYCSSICYLKITGDLSVKLSYKLLFGDKSKYVIKEPVDKNIN